jgi:hypothetical protein
MRKRNSGFLLAFPALAGFLVFYFVPFLITVWYSVSFGIGRREFVGLDNFRDLYTNEMFLLAVKNTLRSLYGCDCSDDTIWSAASVCYASKYNKRRTLFPTFVSVSDDTADRFRDTRSTIFVGIIRNLEQSNRNAWRRRKRLDESISGILDTLHPILLAVYGILCFDLFCKASDDSKRILRIRGSVWSGKGTVFPIHYLTDTASDNYLYDRTFHNECFQVL